jgi:metal-dependent amidase/aminoacylase/carboxypeptidase family protein
MYMASTDDVFNRKGKGGHGAAPHQLIDPVLIASPHYCGVAASHSRNREPANPPSVLSFGRFIADGVTNVIETKLRLEERSGDMNEEWRADGLKHMKKKMAEGIAETVATNLKW